MNIREHTRLAPFTTFRVGGEAQLFTACETEEEVSAAVAHARDRGVPFLPFGSGSNILVPDEGVSGLAAKIEINRISFEERGDTVDVSAGAGVVWDALVQEAAARNLWGIENLAGIPGTVGGAPIQNIGAYGAELADTFLYADAIDAASGTRQCIDTPAARFGYRDSVFKKNRNLILTRIVLRLSRTPKPHLAYRDLADARGRSEPLNSPGEIGAAVRRIRSAKFPDLAQEGTAGSFFKNPVVSRATADALVKKFPSLPIFPRAGGSVKLSLAWLLDHALALKGFAVRQARLFERQPLVIVASRGASAHDIDACAQEVEKRVQNATGITLVREVETFGARR
ncbi:UDP-N-acetylmuramate dehydrogenase [Candidatus Kaiserbacteria bacterium]|nr:UDP-N-acetylmuramate dehydrogenase [Candidatus Kaiserbacteria bacterium]